MEEKLVQKQLRIIQKFDLLSPEEKLQVYKHYELMEESEFLKKEREKR